MTYTGTPETAEAYRFAVNYGRKWNRRMGEMLDSDEVTGIAGETVARHLPDYNPDLHPNCYEWLARKVKYACVDQVRHERGRDAHSGKRDTRRTTLPFDPSLLDERHAEATTESPAITGELVRHFRADDDTGEIDLVLDARQFLDELPRQQREVLEARLAGAEVAEIGVRWGVTGTRISQIMRDVRSRYHSWAGAGA